MSLSLIAILGGGIIVALFVGVIIVLIVLLNQKPKDRDD